MIKEQSNIEWAKSVIGYQCFVDSFSIGCGSIDKKSKLYKSKVYDKAPKRLNWEDEFSDYSYGYSFYGGDLDGITNSINAYLSDFGIDMLYMTPIFKAESNHKYDTIDYTKIDPQFGNTSEFNKLVNTCKDKNIKLILDGVFNHTSYHHEWYLKALKNEHPYKDYYKKDDKGNFLNWNGVETLILLNHENQDIQNYFYNSAHNIVQYWLDQGVDGWRLDVAERLGIDVIKKIKKCITKNYDNKVLYGEVIETYGKDWLGSELLDGAMNYVFLGNTVNYLQNKIDGKTFLYELNKMYNEYPKEQLYQSWNIISSHDTNRMIYEVDGNENLFKIAVALQFTYPGIPMIYNGDELGILPGKKDYNNRQGLDWQRVDILRLKEKGPWKSIQSMDWQKMNEYSSFYYFYKHLIWLRKNSPALIKGDFIPAYYNDDIISYFRVSPEQYALIIVNKGNTQQITIEIPDLILKEKPVLNGVHGHIKKTKLNEKLLDITVYAQNTLILMSSAL